MSVEFAEAAPFAGRLVVTALRPGTRLPIVTDGVPDAAPGDPLRGPMPDRFFDPVSTPSSEGGSLREAGAGPPLRDDLERGEPVAG
ncbi:hypothetical protein AD006_30655 (plasmid) [Pseudonocardia sp. EC080610-09]|uniref:hypothetical protein n=1 Tax=Pseudonocardia sp. EC080619-01 TaxID=1096856 RepID=UPI000705D255|nr:hypothetical protein [Pseudonocardia sp. EC080619-01]ALL79569.1 hypothetical protein AD006_30655 [Pseudonocardia sp. EC080610-09]ALL85477.1 hypothetical protein AD017_30585 [Pseudonocardia sp. EC080619-01]